MKHPLEQELTEDREGRFSQLVSILIINWNGKAYVQTCLRSCLNLCYPKYEIIVIDNNSSDGSAEIVKSQFPEVQLIELKRNLGFASASNVGISAAKGAYVAILCSDIIVDSMWLSHLVEAMTDSGQPRSSKTGIAGGIIYYSQPKDVIWGGPVIMDLTTGSAWHPNAFRRSVQHITDLDYLSGGAVLIKREVFEKVGTLDAEYFLYGEDADFCMRALRAGYQLKCVPRAKSSHLASVDNKISLRAYYFRTCSRIRMYLKNFPLRFLFSAIFFQVLVRPIFEVIWFGQHPASLLLNISALRVNLFRLRETFIARGKVQALGKCKARSRVKDLIMIALIRFSNKRYYRL